MDINSYHACVFVGGDIMVPGDFAAVKSSAGRPDGAWQSVTTRGRTYCAQYTGYMGNKPPVSNELRLDGHRLRMWDGYRWIDIDQQDIKVYRQGDWTMNEPVYDDDIPFSDFSGLFDEGSNL